MMKNKAAVILILLLPCSSSGFEAFLDGSASPEAPWNAFVDAAGGEPGETLIVDFTDPDGTPNQALRINSGPGANEWFIGAFLLDEVAAAIRFRMVDFSDTGKENILCLTTRSKHLAPCPSITLVDGRFKLWSYVESDYEIMDLAPADRDVFHTVYLSTRSDGLTKLWWDGKLVYDGMAPLENPFDGYIEWGSGSWQFSATDTIDFDWVGYGTVADLPLAVTAEPAHGAVFHDASAGFKFDVTSQAGLAPGVATTGIALTVNGVDRTSELVVTGDDRNRKVAFNGLVPERIYEVVAKITDLEGTVSAYPFEFDTFRANSFTFEAEDFNFEGGQFLDEVVLSSFAAPDNYVDRFGVEGIDHFEASTEPGTMPHRYRTDSLVATEPNKDTLRAPYRAAQEVDAGVADYNVAFIEVGEWLNYTRTFPNGRYNIYGRFANGDFTNSFTASLGKVTNATSENQTVTPLGEFKGGPGRGWQTYQYIPLTDPQGSVVAVTLNGRETLRVTSVEGSFNPNFYMLVPASTTTTPRLQVARNANEIVLSWEGEGFTLESTDRLGGTWTAVSNPTNPFRSTLVETARFWRLRQ